jgi:hypothetical protein
MAALFGLAFWKNSRSYPRKSPLWRLGKAVIDTGIAADLTDGGLRYACSWR